MKKFLSTLALAAMVSSPAAADTLRWMTGSPGGSFYPLGGALKGFLEEERPDLKLEVVNGGGIANIKGVGTNKAVLGFANSVTTVDALNGAEPFGTPHTDVCNVAALYPQYFQMVVLKDSEIKSPADFKGISLASQKAGTTGEQFARLVLGVNGLSYDDLGRLNQVGYNDAVSMMKDGNADAFTLVTTAPAGAVMDLAAARDIRMLPVADATYETLKQNMPGLQLGAIPGGTYQGVDEDTAALTWSAHIITRCDAPDDLIYTLTRNVLEHAEALGGVASAAKGLDLERMSQDLGVPFHPAAAKFYAENGIEVAK
ncbi:TAXI family TRAP transporter solute-binding subunit [Sulfitobacter mediterraneus]|uniref:TAXI family TRAP transporter solute-binding subunit n=1 Tax=Sulfitobacter mediterraneus TaxID=83219 RepID=UPI001932BE70|nr:TAXI family TRAP transporter solute-binding subunit [Sulfitobacter mediterraneus]MBM1634336.1 TAXI family TRAP transporter solute-binding subunit [Sulfitobacter mediterraneus]MBM1642153.1 TAXI family TRAP transporter solute-binding subunit [Sulfitobacter mediterraneus]MBM1646202.1 TAXI family TRAP transporter solute-binding subunit [Sulfitobacter mediterraneus]MBM1650248.1 TAXI family TRAP transporter solute-binding subunit [Sulfitobacter mediterraneus]MBM1654270.1 TAXI family TRAP transpor